VIQPDDLEERATQLATNGSRVAVLARRHVPPVHSSIAWHATCTDAAHYTRTLYAVLRALDADGYDRILVEDVPDDDAWIAVRDRLRRAAYRGEK